MYHANEKIFIEQPGHKLQDNPRIIAINLPPAYVGEEEVHEKEDDVYVVMEGTGELLVNKDWLKIKKGDVIHIPAKIVHKIISDEGIKYLVIKVVKDNVE